MQERSVYIGIDCERSVALCIRRVRIGQARTAMEIDYEAAKPPHVQIADWLRQRIIEGELPPGKRLPTEKALQDELGVARTTTRRAMRVLADEGYVLTTPGRGSHVNPKEIWPK
jgi:GntR family transcriptional regulator